MLLRYIHNIKFNIKKKQLKKFHEIKNMDL